MPERGIEPPTYALRMRCSTYWAIPARILSMTEWLYYHISLFMNILLNNKPEILFEGLTIKKLLEKKNIKIKYYAIEINRKIIPKSNHETHVIKDGDRIEIITAIGGG